MYDWHLNRKPCGQFEELGNYDLINLLLAGTIGKITQNKEELF